MRKTFSTLAVLATLLLLLSFRAKPSSDEQARLMEAYGFVEVASVADAMEQLYGKRAYMSHDMRPLNAAKIAGPAVTVLFKREEHQEGAKALQGMLDTIDEAAPGSIYVMVLEDGLDYAGLGGLMSTAMKYRGLTGAIVDGGIEIRRRSRSSVSGVQPGRSAFDHRKSLPVCREEHPCELWRHHRQS